MHPSKLTIRISNGLIESVDNSENTEIIIDGVSTKFENAYAIPGIVDAHAHVIGLGENLNTLRLEKATSKSELIQLVQQIEVKDGWISGRGWNEENWIDKDLSNLDLDAVNSDIPIFLVRVDGHAAWANTKALQASGITSETPNPSGGSIQKDSVGTPTGILIDNAIELVRDYIPKPSNELVKKYILDACYECLRNGITEVHDMDVHLNNLQSYKELDNDNLLPIRLVQYIRGFDGEYKDIQPIPYSGNNLQIVGLKFYADGALGSRGALMIDKYNDADTYGLELISCDELYERASEGCKNGWDIAVHAIGDKANRNVLDVFERLRNDSYENVLRIEHSQLVHPDDIERFSELTVIASVQPIHCTSDKSMAIKRLGEDYKFSYPWKTLHDTGANLIAGSDFPIESHNPFLGIDAFVNRKANKEEITWQKEETLSLEEALKSYCYTPHFAIGNTNSGLLQPGKRADIIIIDNDLSQSENIRNTKVIATISNGKLTKYL
jgi:predicted amidohydrolase YtcJ